MNTPRFILGFALLFWGWQADLFIWAAVMAVILEGSRFVSWRWEFSDTDLKRIWFLCTVLFLGVTVILLASDETISRPFLFMQWQPFIYLPMILAQAYGSRERIPVTIFSWFARRARPNPLGEKGVNVSWIYFALCVFAASTANRRSPWFYPGVVAMIALALFAIRPRRFALPVWLAMICAVGVCGYAGQEGLRQLQSALEGSVGNWLLNLFHRQADFRQSRTSIGDIGRIKLSGTILWRIESLNNQPPPSLIREAAYDSFSDTSWSVRRARKSEFANVPLEMGGDTLRFQPAREKYSAVTIAGQLNRKRAILPLPMGTIEITNFPAVVKTNLMGVALVEEGPGFGEFCVKFLPNESFESRPTGTDYYDIPEAEEPALAEIARELQLASKNTEQKLAAIRKFFSDKFTYSTYITTRHVDRSGKLSPLTLFLSRVRSGHCEYFATATVLLLREAGIPARYATGYAVQESSKKGNTYVVRERHAHAWTLVYRDDKHMWEDFDTTPASWDEVENERASFWESINDFFSGIKFYFSKWRWGKTSYTKYLIWLLVPLVLFLAWRIVSNKKRKRSEKKGAENQDEISWPGLDSEFYLIEQKLAGIGLERAAGESLHAWRKRVEGSLFLSGSSLEKILMLHQQHRFDPLGLSASQRQALRKSVENWLAEFSAAQAKQAGNSSRV